MKTRLITVQYSTTFPFVLPENVTVEEFAAASESQSDLCPEMEDLVVRALQSASENIDWKGGVVTSISMTTQNSE